MSFIDDIKYILYAKFCLYKDSYHKYFSSDNNITFEVAPKINQFDTPTNTT